MHFLQLQVFYEEVDPKVLFGRRHECNIDPAVPIRYGLVTLNIKSVAMYEVIPVNILGKNTFFTGTRVRLIDGSTFVALHPSDGTTFETWLFKALEVIKVIRMPISEYAKTAAAKNIWS